MFLARVLPISNFPQDEGNTLAFLKFKVGRYGIAQETSCGEAFSLELDLGWRNRLVGRVS